MIEELADGEQVDLELITFSPGMFLSGSSPDSETRQNAAESPPAEPASFSGTPPLTLAQQLRAANLQAAQLESLLIKNYIHISW